MDDIDWLDGDRGHWLGLAAQTEYLVNMGTTSLLNRLLSLNGLAIIGVVANHATSWSETAMFWWADRYREVVSPNYDMLGGPFHYSLLAVRKLTMFAVPSFLFSSGMFLAYTARGDSFPSWRAVRSRVTSLLVPYLVWSAVHMAIGYVEGGRSGLLELAEELVTGERYWYILLLCQLYLLSPCLIQAARHHDRLLVCASGLVAASYMGVQYVRVVAIRCGMNSPLSSFLDAVPYAYRSIISLQLFLVVGLVCGFRLTHLQRLISRSRWSLLGTTIVLAALAFCESEVVYRATGKDLWRSSIATLPSTLYALSFVFLFLALPAANTPIFAHLHRVGKDTLGIYLLQGLTLEFVARAIQKIMPWSLAYHLLFYLALVLIAVEAPRMFMWAISKLPARRLYRFLFG